GFAARAAFGSVLVSPTQTFRFVPWGPPESFNCFLTSCTAFTIPGPYGLSAPVRGTSAPRRGAGDSIAGAGALRRVEAATTGRVAKPFPTQSRMAARARLSAAAGLGIESLRLGVHFGRHEPSPLQGRQSNQNLVGARQDHRAESRS